MATTIIHNSVDASTLGLRSKGGLPAGGMPDAEGGLPVGLLVAGGIAFGPLLGLFFARLWGQRPHYGFFPFLLAGIVVLLRRFRAETGYIETRRGAWLCRGCFVAAALLLMLAVALFSPWVAAAGAVFFVGQWLLAWLGSGNWPQLIPIWLLFWLIVPPPFRMDEQLIQDLRGAASVVSAEALDVLKVDHFMDGNVLRLPHRTLFLEEACSGVNSLFALLTATAWYVVWARRRLVHAGLLLTSAVFWAVLVNVARVTTIAAAEAKYGIDLAAGWKHDLLGYGLLFVGAGLVYSTDRLLGLLLGPIRHMESVAIRRGGSHFSREYRSNPLSRMWNFLFASSTSPPEQPRRKGALSSSHKRGSRRLIWVGLPAAAAIAAVQLMVLAAEPRMKHTAATPGLLSRSVLSDLDDWKIEGFAAQERDRGSDEGRFSQAWTYTGKPGRIKVSFDYPFVGWHELTRCYRSLGWEVTSRVLVPLDGEIPRRAVEVDLTKPTGECALLLFEEMDSVGQPIHPRPRHWKGLAARLESSPTLRLLGRSPTAVSPEAVTYQMQLLLPVDAPLEEPLRKEIRSKFQRLSDEARAELSRSGD